MGRKYTKVSTPATTHTSKLQLDTCKLAAICCAQRHPENLEAHQSNNRGECKTCSCYDSSCSRTYCLADHLAAKVSEIASMNASVLRYWSGVTRVVPCTQIARSLVILPASMVSMTAASSAVHHSARAALLSSLALQQNTRHHNPGLLIAQQCVKNCRLVSKQKLTKSCIPCKKQSPQCYWIRLLLTSPTSIAQGESTPAHIALSMPGTCCGCSGPGASPTTHA